MRKGRRFAIDFGKSRIGLAACDRDGILATPLDAIDGSQQADNTIALILKEIAVIEPIEVYVGDPLSLSGATTSSTLDSRAFAAQLAASISVPVFLVDERLTTVNASAKLRDSGINSRQAKSLIDSASAVEILNFALESERSSGKVIGVLVEVKNG